MGEKDISACQQMTLEDFIGDTSCVFESFVLRSYELEKRAASPATHAHCRTGSGAHTIDKHTAYKRKKKKPKFFWTP